MIINLLIIMRKIYVRLSQTFNAKNDTIRKVQNFL